MTRHSGRVRWFLLFAAAAMIAAGLLLHGFRDVLSQAVMICLECIGIG